MKSHKKKADEDNESPYFHSPLEMLGNFEDEDDFNYFEPISYTKLEKVIS